MVEALVVGSGFGGSAAAYSLARAGLKTLLLERGDWPRRDADDWSPRAVMIEQRYRSSSPMLIKQYGARDFRESTPFLEEVVGGMSVFYGAATMRMRERDFARWPIRYADLEPSYGEAERLLEVHGQAGSDPCEPYRSVDYPHSLQAMDLAPPARRIQRAATALGYRPFRIPLAVNLENDRRPRCVRCGTCDGFPCAIGAKNDATALLERAREHGLEIRTNTAVRRLRVDGEGRVTALDCVDRRDATPFEIPAPKVVVLAAGTLQSPAILLRSGLQRLPQHARIGRGLMRHCNAFVTYAFPYRTESHTTFHKQLCFTDFYEDLRAELGTSVGTIQDMCMPPPEVVEHYAPRGLKTLAGLVSRHLLGLLCIAEDDPNPDNRVTLSDRLDRLGLEVLQVAHAYSADDQRRLDHLVARARRILRRCGGVPAHLFRMDSFAHGVGTLRFGERPEEAVLDRTCALFGVKNLFVVDGSFMPTSGGVNPSLTIVANSLRVAGHIVARYRELA
jgi:choline dehydrogenase-like flavoprotein